MGLKKAICELFHTKHHEKIGMEKVSNYYAEVVFQCKKCKRTWRHR